MADWISRLTSAPMIRKIEPSETVKQGRWLLQDGRMVADEVCQRILALVRSCLIEVANDASGWKSFIVILKTADYGN